jgi:formylglycine-generating enzyme required for sulfatase activity
MKCLRLSVCMLLAVVSLTAFTGCPAAGPAPGETQIFDGIEFVWIPAGSFTMGSPADEVGRNPDETQHKVILSRGFWLGKYEVTQAQWTAVMGSNPSLFQSPDKPVEKVSWEDARYFITALNVGKASIGGPYRLPTESEWEYAYRAGTTARFYWGDDPTETDIDDYAWYNFSSSSQTHDAGEKLPNAWGLYDIAGNVYEWCQDRYGAYPTGPVTDPQGADFEDDRVLRGGSWSNGSGLSRAAYRRADTPVTANEAYGFRLARTPD